MRKLTFCCLIVGFLFLAMTNILAEESEISRKVPLPRKIQITVPSPDLPKEVAAFSGRWEGYWDVGNLPTILIVENVESKKAEGVYAWGLGPHFMIKPDYFRFKGTVTIGPNPEMRFAMGPCGYRFRIGQNLKTLIGVRACQAPLSADANITMNKID